MLTVTACIQTRTGAAEPMALAGWTLRTASIDVVWNVVGTCMDLASCIGMTSSEDRYPGALEIPSPMAITTNALTFRSMKYLRYLPHW